MVPVQSSKEKLQHYFIGTKRWQSTQCCNVSDAFCSRALGTSSVLAPTFAEYGVVPPTGRISAAIPGFEPHQSSLDMVFLTMSYMNDMIMRLVKNSRFVSQIFVCCFSRWSRCEGQRRLEKRKRVED